ncbi:putative monocarboxylate transporter 12 [Apostichopus japonicus]|uniref:Putative monocarboxylate transporter 12 n=1 Tax=Stichopus japonicus TaxID=307972 RepID=A0A2G8JNB8_STIJA|nr:putative monocarboxylate transporter 12 [Apostichopus japonicus]
MKQGKISERLKSFISRTDTWLVSLSYFFTFSALSIYQVNMVSHFESLESLTLDDVWLIMTVTNVSDVVTRIFVMVTGGNFLCRPVYVIIGTNIVLSLVSFSYSVLVSVWPLVTISLCLGFARSTTVVMSWNMVVNLIGSQYADYVVTLVMYLQGFSYLVGTLPPGAIFDATGSYDLAFKIISLSFFMAAAILIFLAIRSSRRIREKRLSIEKESTETKTPRVSLVSYSTNMT